MNSATVSRSILLLVSGLPLVLALVISGCSFQSSPAPSAWTPPRGGPTNDPYLWLEAVSSAEALAWAAEQNAASTYELTNSPSFEPLRQRLLAIYDSRERIPFVTKLGPHLYNFWRDDQHIRGIFRRTSLAEYRKPQPTWETVLDLDQLADDENENWVWKGFSPLHPDYDRCLVSLSRGGADATVLREFDLENRRFVADGFTLPEGKSTVAWRNRDTLYVGADFGPGSLTRSGYPRIIKEWQRGTPLARATPLFEGRASDVAVGAAVIHDRGHTYEVIQQAVSFYANETFLRRQDQWVRIDKPADAEVSTFDDQLLLTLRSDWTVNGRSYPAGALLASPLEDYLDGQRRLAVLFQPGDRKSLAGVSGTRHHLILNELEEVRNRLYQLTPKAGQWHRQALEAPGLGTVSAWGVEPEHSDDYWLTVTDFLTPSTLYHGEINGPSPDPIKSLPAFFHTHGLRIQQFEAWSHDGTRVPYFQVAPERLKHHGRNPTLLEGYGGFEVPLLSSYDPTTGAAWLENGHVYVLANIRGGGEFGPRWHQAALQANRQRAYNDFIAIAEDLVRRRVTSPKHLGIVGGSNGGLLMGNMLVQRPDLFGAIVCQVPLLDMRRYHRLLAGASWMEEYGNPDDPRDWLFLRRYSPYHNLRPDVAYPRTLFTTSTRDDRVHPAHARKMVARMRAQGHDVLYYENIEGGHGGAANNPQRAFMEALAFAFLQKELTR
jgi:prolyl oligopeptidase